MAGASCVQLSTRVYKVSGDNMAETILFPVQAAAAVAAIACPPAGSGDNGELKPWDGRSPLSIAAAIIYLVTRLPNVMPTPVAIALGMLTERACVFACR